MMMMIKVIMMVMSMMMMVMMMVVTMMVMINFSENTLQDPSFSAFDALLTLVGCLDHLTSATSHGLKTRWY